MHENPEEPEQPSVHAGQRARAAVDRGALTGSIVSSIFAVAWSFWGSSGLHFFAALCVQLAATLVALVIIIPALRRRFAIVRGASTRDRTVFSSRAFVIVVVAEVLAIGGGNLVLTLTGHEQFRIALIAAIVGLHFLVLGRVIWPGFLWLGAAMLTVAVAGTVVGLITDNANLILVTTGLGAAACLFVAAATPILRRASAAN